MERHICIGSQLYINKTDTDTHVRELVRKMQASGLEIIRLFMIWDILEPRCGEWNFSVYDACFDEAEKCGLAVVPTLMSVSPPGWMKLTKGSQDIADIDDGEIWESGLSYVRKVVSHYSLHPALHSWILWNEPSRNIKICKSNIDDFSSFLLAKYGSIEKYNGCHYRQFADFEDLCRFYLKADDSLAFKAYNDSVDELDYSVYNLCSKLTDIAGVVSSIDPVHPVHINPHDMVRGGYTDGQNFFEEGKTVDFLGCSAHPSWHSVDFGKKRIPLSVGYFADVARAASGDRERFWVTELQGGTNIFSGRDCLSPSPHDVNMWLGECFGSGAEAVVFWCFNTRSDGFEGGEWGLLNQKGGPSERLEAVSDFSAVIKRNQALFDASHPPEPDVYILYSDSTIRLNMLETAYETANGLRRRNNGKFSVTGAYTAITDMGLIPGIISEEQLKQGQLPAESVLILPDIYAPEEGTLEAVYRFAENGGTVIADGLCGMKTPEGKISEKNLLTAEALFGAEVTDVAAADSSYAVLCNSSTVNSDFLRLKFRTTSAETDGDVLVNSVGNGKAIRLPGIMFRRYFREEEESFLKLLKHFVTIKKDLYLLNPSVTLKMKVLEARNEKILFLINCADDPAEARIKGIREYTVLSKHRAAFSGGELNVQLMPEDTAIIRIKENYAENQTL